jgi:hypothetical protein
MSETTEIELWKDILYGAAAIAEFMFGGCSQKQRRRIYYLAAKSRLPIFRLKTRLCARKSKIRKWIEDQENRVVPNAKNAGATFAPIGDVIKAHR